MNRKLLLLSMTTLILVFGVSQRANAETTICSETSITGTFVVNDGGFQCPDPGKSYYNSDDDYMIVFPNGDFILPSRKIYDYLDIRLLHGNRYTIFYFLKDTPYFLKIMLMNSTIKEDDIDGEQNLIALRRVMTIDFYENTENFNKHNLSDKEVLDFLKERVIQNFKFDETTEGIGFFINSNSKIVGKYKEGTILTAEEIQKENEKFAAEGAEREAAEEKKKQAAEKRDVASFKKKYGFDPLTTGWKAVFKIGRTESAFNAYNKWLEDHGYKNYTFKLIVDSGTTQCYDLFDEWALTKYGRFWVSNGKISSVAWTRW